jgi:Sensors of blue-light using FAD
MFQLVYISTSRIQVTATLLDSILAVSRINNDRAGVTGMLVAGTRRFLQALEGPEQAVMDTFARIKNDPRHHAFVLLTGRSIERRAFGDWSMASERGSEGEGAETLAQTVAALTETLADKSLRAHFVGFAELQGESV